MEENVHLDCNSFYLDELADQLFSFSLSLTISMTIFSTSPLTTYLGWFHHHVLKYVNCSNSWQTLFMRRYRDLIRWCKQTNLRNQITSNLLMYKLQVPCKSKLADI